jgi:hypothetical protein
MMARVSIGAATQQQAAAFAALCRQLLLGLREGGEPERDEDPDRIKRQLHGALRGAAAASDDEEDEDDA